MLKSGKLKQNNAKGRTRNTDDANFDMSSYRRGTTLATFQSDKSEQSQRLRLHRLRQLRRRILALLVVLVGVMMLGIGLLMQYTGSISSVKTSDGTKLTEADQQRYIDILNKYYDENRFDRFSFVRRNSVLNAFVKQNAPEVAEIKVRSSGIMSSYISIKFRKPVAQWKSDNKTNFVDESGVVFERNFFTEPALSIEDDSGAKGVDGMATSANFLSFVGQTAVALQKQQLVVQRVVIPRGAARYVEFYLYGRDYPFKAQITRNATSQASDIAVMARYVDARGIKPSYVDCRVVGKAFWR